jgi:signal peptidase I
MAWLSEFGRAWAPAILAVVVIRLFLFEPFRIPSGSMVPTLLIGDHVLVTKFSYGLFLPMPPCEFIKSFPPLFCGRKELMHFADPQRGDIIVFRYPRDEKTHYIKRVVGIPGDRIRVAANQIFLNGEPIDRVLQDKYDFVDDQCRSTPQKHYVEKMEGVPHHVLTNVGFGGGLSNMEEKVVPPGSVFMMGDNRDHSEDSRMWNFVRYDQITGKAHFIWLSWDRCGGEYGRIRSDRFFRGLYRDPALDFTLGQ